MNQPIRLLGAALLLALAACGKMGPPETPAHSTYPKTYPAGAAPSAYSTTPLGPPDTTDAKAAVTMGPPDTNAPAFTGNGAWIDPNMHRPTINPRADLDKWHLPDASATMGY